MGFDLESVYLIPDPYPGLPPEITFNLNFQIILSFFFMPPPENTKSL